MEHKYFVFKRPLWSWVLFMSLLLGWENFLDWSLIRSLSLVSKPGKCASCVANFVWFMSKMSKYFDSCLFRNHYIMNQNTVVIDTHPFMRRSYRCSLNIWLLDSQLSLIYQLQSLKMGIHFFNVFYKYLGTGIRVSLLHCREKIFLLSV